MYKVYGLQFNLCKLDFGWGTHSYTTGNALHSF